MENKIKNFDRNKGITLIALVITIVVLLILAGVTIATLTGDNGIITRTNQAKEETEKAGAKEKVQMEVAGSFDNYGRFNMDKLKENLKNNLGLQDSDIKDNPDGSITVTVDGYEVTVDSDGNVTVEGEAPPTEEPEPPTQTAKPGEIVTGGNATYTDGTDTAIIPEGFAVVTDPDTINNGLVISDKEYDNMNNDAQGNQFVWVPVSKENFETEFVRHDFGNQNIADSDFINTEPTTGKYYEPNPANTAGTTETTKAEVIAMYNSVQTNGGFYIARFEAGKENNKAVSKKGATVYNHIGWSNSKDMTIETGGAVEKAREMYPGHSTLCYGVQWDAVMRWISKDSTLSGYLTNSTGKGNYNTDDTIATGSNDAYQMKNIYDMAGNVSEWTMEAYLTDSRITRGGSYLDNGSSGPASDRFYEFPDAYDLYIGFRPALYV